MPAVNPRITITLTPEIHSILKRLSTLTGNSQSALVGGLLEQSHPVFERMATVLDAASRLKSEGIQFTSEITDSLAAAQFKLEAQLGLFLDTADDGYRPVLKAAEAGRAVGAKLALPGRASREAGVTPVPVTRGSGHPRERQAKGNRTEGGLSLGKI